MNILFNMIYQEVNELFEINQQQYFKDIKKKSAYIPLGLEHSNYSSDCYNQFLK